ncbi:MAG TPA: palindromic element RPE5 domain-containing protein [Rickettsia endosymbiont of Omalisus fontisbellaquei]|nr:palindromic element RPE5 domain-containing protein [Rickettsia endosymbiont of Omalisus fontisbellaquei]
MKKSNLAVSREGEERILNVQHSRTYKDIVTNFSSGAVYKNYCIFWLFGLF